MARLWTPAQGASGLLVIPTPPPLLVVVGAHVIEVSRDAPDGISAILGGVQQNRMFFGEDGNAGATQSSPDNGGRNAPGFLGRLRPMMLGGLVIVSSSRQKEPTRIVGHPDLASGASVQRGNTLYVSVTEAVYRESRGEDVEIRLTPTDEDREALADLRTRARQRWENDRLPDGWTRPLPPRPEAPSVTTKEASLSPLSEELRSLAERIHAKTEEEDE